MILVDSNILIDIIEADQQWHRWSIEQISTLSGRLAIDEVVVAEVGAYFPDLSSFLEKIEQLSIALVSIDAEAAYEGGRAYARYRANRGDAPRTILADFLIGGHAVAARAAILTRDPRFYRSYFPIVALITPELGK